MTRKILVDADALVGLFLEGDGNHDKALKIKQELENDWLYITQYTVAEVVTVLSKKVSQKVARECLAWMRAQDWKEVVLSEENRRLADEIFAKQNKKGTSWVDCFNVAVYRLDELNTIFSFDKFYKKMGVRGL